MGSWVNDVFLVFFGLFVVWVLWGMLQYAFSRWPDDPSDDTYRDHRYYGYRYRFSNGRWTERSTLRNVQP